MDIFISYAHLDNEPLTPGQRGWITRFHEALSVRLGQVLGTRTTIWRDPKLSGSDTFGETILEELRRARIVVSIVTPRYVKSEWCLREASEFLQVARQTGGITVRNKNRLIKVVKTPVPRGEIPAPLGEFFQEQLGYEFHEVTDGGRDREFDEELGPKYKRRFLERIYDVAEDLACVLKVAGENSGTGPMAPAGSSGKTVYLATTTGDLNEARLRLRRELQDRGHVVLPDAPQPTTGPEFEAAVRADLARCQLAIHPVGGRYGLVPEDSSDSVVVLQNRLAAERHGQPGFLRYLWLPRDLPPKDDRQRAFVKRLFEDPSAQLGAEIVQDDVERLKGLVLEKLTPPPASAKPALAATAMGTATRSGPARVYLVCDPRDDGPMLQSVDDALYNAGFEVNRPVWDGTEAEVTAAHRQFLQACDAVLIFYGAASRSWVDMKLLDLSQAPGYGRESPFKSVLVCVAPPADPNKERFRTRAASVVRLGETLDPALLAPFLQSISASGTPQ